MSFLVSLPCFCNISSVFYFKLMSNLVILGEKRKSKKNLCGDHFTSPLRPGSFCLFVGWLDPPDREGRHAETMPSSVGIWRERSAEERKHVGGGG